MIRPITVLTFILACGSGMYLYQAKHRVHLLDQQIDLAVKQTATVREQSRALHAEWMLLNDPDRLHRLAAQYLTNLQPVAPMQFTDLTDLDSRLPPPVAPAAPVATPLPAAVGAVVASAAFATPKPNQAASAASTADQAATDAAGQSQDGDTVQANLDVVPAPPPAPLAAPSGEVVSAPVATQAPPAGRAPRPVIAEASPAARTPRSVIAPVPHPAARAADISPVRPQPVVATAHTPPHVPVWKPVTRHPVFAEAAPPRFIRSERPPMPVIRAQTVPQSAYGGSMLGMAHGMSSLPRPVPLNAAYNNNNSGG
jgi:hypothetical protein